MSRQINPGIFGDSFSPSHVKEGSHSFEALAPLEPVVSTHQFDALEEKVETQRFENDQISKSTNLRLEKTLQKTLILEERLNYIINEVNERLSFVMARFKEKSTSETKIESLIERHNQIVQSFELRLGQSQRVVENQSLQLAKQQALIEDARRQLEKLKRL